MTGVYTIELYDKKGNLTKQVKQKNDINVNVFQGPKYSQDSFFYKGYARGDSGSGAIYYMPPMLISNVSLYPQSQSSISLNSGMEYFFKNNMTFYATNNTEPATNHTRILKGNVIAKCNSTSQGTAGTDGYVETNVSITNTQAYRRYSMFFLDTKGNGTFQKLSLATASPTTYQQGDYVIFYDSYTFTLPVDDYTTLGISADWRLNPYNKKIYCQSIYTSKANPNIKNFRFYNKNVDNIFNPNIVQEDLTDSFTPRRTYTSTSNPWNYTTYYAANLGKLTMDNGNIQGIAYLNSYSANISSVSLVLENMDLQETVRYTLPSSAYSLNNVGVYSYGHSYNYNYNLAWIAQDDNNVYILAAPTSHTASSTALFYITTISKQALIDNYVNVDDNGTYTLPATACSQQAITMTADAAAFLAKLYVNKNMIPYLSVSDLDNITIYGVTKTLDGWIQSGLTFDEIYNSGYSDYLDYKINYLDPNPTVTNTSSTWFTLNGNTYSAIRTLHDGDDIHFISFGNNVEYYMKSYRLPNYNVFSEVLLDDPVTKTDEFSMRIIYEVYLDAYPKPIPMNAYLTAAGFTE
ncbi:hypothetical protein FACS1894208_05020 [Clostridia bacterium]|nr:hypothetical protein FACS1894208_05020 [Clostridia bacterium]